MDKGNNDINLGLTQEELELLVKNSNNPDMIKNFEDKLDNCDLSKSAIELIDEENLAAVARISDSIGTKYPAAPSNSIGKYLIGGIISLGVIVVIATFLLPSESPIIEETKVKNTINQDPEYSNGNTSIIQETNPQVIEQSNENLDPPVEVKIENQDLKELPNIETKNQEDTSITGPIEKESTPEKKASKEDEIKRSAQKQEKVEYVAVKEERQVRNITVTEDVDQKYKDLQYSFTDLVSYSGGKSALEKELFSKLKDKVKDTDVPERNSSIVFKFNVTQKGKVKDLNVLSIVSPELQQIIQETTLNLTNWNKGKKRIPRSYTIYVTFK